MATPHTPGYVLRELRAAGLEVQTYDDWRTHHRPGDWGPVHGVAVHHFGPYSTQAGAVEYARTGSAELPGPLYQMLVDRQGVVHLVGHGRTNHAGKVDEDVLQALIDEGDLPKPTTDTVDGNARLYSLCLINRGDGRQTHPAEQLEAAAAACAVLCRGHDGWTHRSVVGHKELTRRKIDPTIDMGAFRRRVRDRWAGMPEPAPKRTLGQRVAELEERVTRLEGVRR